MARAVYLDVDNTLLDNDAAKRALEDGIAALVPAERARRFWELYEIVRCDEDYVDFPATLARFRAEFPHESCSDEVAQLIEDFPYRDYVYPGAFDAIAEVWRVATPVILSDGDSVFQPRKIARAGLEDAVRGNVLVFVHKEQHLDELARRFPGSRPAFVDDKAPILGRIKRRLGDAATTIHVHQGKYAAARVDRGDPAPDVEIDAIAGLGAVVARL
ncbi:MAG TPA: HAD family hydrolase [Candidatus Limnocylindria bacterium]